MLKLLVSRIKSCWFYALTPQKAGEGILSVVFPLYLLHVMQAQIGTVGVLSGLISLTAMIGAMFWGNMSDRYHKPRRIMVIGCLLSGLCLLGMGLANSLTQLIMLCLLYGFFSIAPAPISSVLIMETSPKSLWDREFGVFSKIGGWGFVIGLFLGLWLMPLLQQWLSPVLSLRVTLLALAVFALWSAWWSARAIPSDLAQIPRQQFIDVTQRLPRLTITERVLYVPRRLLFVCHPNQVPRLAKLMQQPLQRYYAASAIMFCGFIIVLTPFPLFLHDVFHMETSLLFILMLVRSLASIPCYEWAGQWTQRISPKRLIIWTLAGRIISFCGLASLYWLSDSALLMISLLGLNILIGMTWSAIAIAGPILVGQLATPGHQGEAMGLYNAIQGVAQILGAILGGYLAQWIGYYGAFIIGALFLLLAMRLFSQLHLQDAVAPDTDRITHNTAAQQAA